MSASRTAAAATLALAAGLAAAHAATDGFAAYTIESARRLAVLRAPQAVPDLAIDLVGGDLTSLSSVPGRVLLVDFIYTSCPTYCTALGSVYARLEAALAPEIASGRVRLVSISFDAARDGPRQLRAYRARFSRNGTGWDLGRPAHAGDLRLWLDAFGVVVIPDGLGGYAHNAAVHIVDAQRRLAAIHDFDDIEGIAAKAREIAYADAPRPAAR